MEVYTLLMVVIYIQCFSIIDILDPLEISKVEQTTETMESIEEKTLMSK
jgi:hypothetical protein